MQTTHMATPVLEVAHLEKVYGALGNVTRALNDVSFTVNRGEFVGIMGASGSGKSTLLNCVSTIDSATSGTIRINGQDVTRMKQAKLSQFRREELGFIFQDSNLLDTLTARENIALPLTIARTNSARSRPACRMWQRACPSVRCSTSIPTRCPAVSSSALPRLAHSSPTPP